NEESGGTPFTLSGVLAVTFGDSGSFSATITGQQIDLDAPLGEGKRADVTAALSGLLARLNTLPVPSMSGYLGVDVPTVIAGGSGRPGRAERAAVPMGERLSGGGGADGHRGRKRHYAPSL